MLGLRRKRTNLHEKYDYPNPRCVAIRSIVGADKIAVAMQDCRIAANHKRRQMAECTHPL